MQKKYAMVAMVGGCLLMLSATAMIEGGVSMRYSGSGNATWGVHKGEAFLRLDRGEQLRLECYANKPIHLHLPNEQDTSTSNAEQEVWNRASKFAVENGLVVTIENFSRSDAGRFICSTADNQTSLYVSVATEPNERSRLRILNISSAIIEITENDTLDIFMEAKVQPRLEYAFEWYKTRLYHGINKPKRVTSNTASSSGNSSDSYWKKETLHIPRATLFDAGIYELRVLVDNETEATLNWTVLVHPVKRLITDLGLRSHSSISDDVVLIDHGITIECTVNDANITGISMTVLDGSEWTAINGSQLSVVRYSSETRIAWNTTLQNDTSFSCSDEDSHQMEELLVRVSSISDMRIIRSDNDGRLQLICQLPIGTESQVYWFKGDEGLGPMNGTEVNFTQSFAVDPMDFSSPYGKFECMADTDYGREVRSYEILDVVRHQLSNGARWALGVVGALVAGGFVICAILIVRERRRNVEQKKRLQTLFEQMTRTDTETTTDTQSEDSADQKPLHERIDELKYNQDYEIARERITFEKFLGNGEFGSVYLCRVSKQGGEDVHVDSVRAAAKRPRDRHNIEHYEALAAELRIMIAVSMHPNVLCLIGAVVKHLTSNYLYVITELCELGDLRSFVANNAKHYVDEVVEAHTHITDSGYLIPNSNRGSAHQLYKAEVSREWDTLMESSRSEPSAFSTRDMISFGYQIAHGMQYLVSKMCIHRDLAARNIFLTQRRIVRIADFGLARKDEPVYRMTSDCPVPIRWMSPEALTHKEFSEKSDVWSYGVLLWELFTFGGYPYAHIQDNNDVYDALCEGQQLEKPPRAPARIFSLMQQCWHFDTAHRATFAQCTARMEKELLRVSPLAKERLEDQLEQDLMEMQHYAQYRDSSMEVNVTTKICNVSENGLQQVYA